MQTLKTLKFSLLMLLLLGATVNLFSQQKSGGYAIVRVFDCNKAVGMGSGYMGPKIIITYEDATQEEVELLPYNEKNEKTNLLKITATLNAMRQKGYLLMGASTIGDQGNIVSDFTFMKN
jgi:hypothetical protein